jgi:iron(III) transport system permease protein
MGVLSSTLPVVPLVLPPIALSVGWIFLAEKSAGLLNVAARAVMSVFGVQLVSGPIDVVSWYGLLMLYIVYFVPFVFVLVSSALRNTDSALEEASRSCGASPLTTLVRVSLPAVRPALAASCLLILLLGVAQFSFGRTVGVSARVDVLAVYMVYLFQSYPPSRDAAVVVGLLVLAVVATAWLVEQRIMSGHGHATISARGHTPSLVSLGPLRWVARALMLGYVGGASVLPLAALLLVALQPYWTPQFSLNSLSLDNFKAYVLADGYSRRALIDSIFLGLTGATVGIVVAAILASYASAKGGAVSRIIDGVARSPGAFSHIVLAVAFLIAFGGAPIFLAGTLTILLLVYVLMNMPQAWVAGSSAMQQVGQELIDASLLSGGSRGRTFSRVTLPLMLPGLAAGWAMLFVVMVGDLTASAILAGTNTPVVGFVILDVFDNGTYSELAALSATVGLITGSIVALVLRLARPRFRTVESAQ